MLCREYISRQAGNCRPGRRHSSSVLSTCTQPPWFLHSTALFGRGKRRTAGLRLLRKFFNRKFFHASDFIPFKQFQFQLHYPCAGSAKSLRLSPRQFPFTCHHNLYRPSVGRATKAGGSAKHADPAPAPIGDKSISPAPAGGRAAFGDDPLLHLIQRRTRHNVS